MTKAQLWQTLLQRNPRFEQATRFDHDASVMVTIGGLEKLVYLAYEQGHTQGIENGKAIAEREEKPKGDFADLFGSLFGGK